MKQLYKNHFASLTLLSCFAIPVVAAEEESTFVDMIKNGKTTLNFRFRIEDVDQAAADDGDDLTATATTLRTRLTFQTGTYKKFAGLVEFDNVSELLDVDYNTGPGRPVFPDAAAIIDPEGTDLNQSYISYTNDENTVKYGRQRILLDNQRFVGGVGWRQNEQTYDAMSVTNTSVDKLNVFYAYVYNTNRIFGDEVAAGDHKMSTHLLNVKYDFATAGSLTGYKYIIDNEITAAYSCDTTGIRYTGKSSAFGYTAEFAMQSDTADNPSDYSANYLFFEGSYDFKPVSVKAGYEILGADDEGQFITPLATLHGFQGWTDIFLGGGSGNIVGGIKDMYVGVGGPIGPVKTWAYYHDMTSDDSSLSGMDDLGSEIGIVVSGSAGPVELLFKYADYSADDYATDTSKLWLMATMTF